MRINRKRIGSIVFFATLIVFAFLPFMIKPLHGSSYTPQEQVPISVTVNANISQGLIYIYPLPSSVQVFGNNYYLSNSLGYVLYSYLFSNYPPLLVWYEPYPSTQTYYFVYGGNTQSSGVTTGVFSFYTQFYYLNTSIFNVSRVSVIGGTLVLSGQNSLVTFTSSAIRYSPGIVLYSFGSSAVVSPPQLSYSGYVPPGSIVTVNIFSYSPTQSVPAYTAFPFATTYWVLSGDSYVNTGQFIINGNIFSYNAQVYYGNPSYPNKEVYTTTLPSSNIYGLGIGSSIGLQYPSSLYLAPVTFVPNNKVVFNNTFIVGQSASFGINSALIINPVYVFIPSLISGSNIMVYNNSKWYYLPVQSSYLKLDPSHIAMYIFPYNSSNYIYFYDIPQGSTIIVKYSNGTTLTLTASGNPVNTVGGVNLVNLKVYGVGVVGITIQPSITGTQTSYNLFAGFTDFNNKAGLIINTTGVYVFNTQTVIQRLSPTVTFPMDVGVGYVDIGGKFYLIGFYYSPNGFYTFISPLPKPVASTGIVPYVNYNGTVPISLSAIAITLPNGFYYETNGLITITTSQPTPLQSAVLSLTTYPGQAIVNNGGTIYQTTIQNTSSSLTFIGFNGYTLFVQYGSIQSQVVITNSFYPTNLPTNLQVVVTISQSTRTIVVSTSPLPVKPIQVANVNISSISATIPNSGINVQNELATNMDTSTLSGIAIYYGMLAIAVASYRYSSKLWSSTLFLSFATLSIALIFNVPSVLPFSVGAIILGFIFKKFDI